MVDRRKIQDKIRSLKQSLRKLSELSRLPEKTFLGNFIYFDSAKYNLITAIEAVIDICNHIISREGFEVPATSADSIKILVKYAILPSAYQDTFVSMVKFRNKAVHLYSEIRDDEVYAILGQHLEDFEVFIKAVLEYVDKKR